MGGMLLYVPGRLEDRDPKRVFKRAGCEELLADGDTWPQCAEPEVRGGPDDGVGVLWIWIDRDREDVRPLYLPDEQEWFKASRRVRDGETLEAGRYWFGWWKDKPPAPSDLARRELLAGELVPLGKQSWQVPTVRELPRSLGRDESGAFFSRLAEEDHREWFDRTMELVQELAPDEQGRIYCTEASHFDYAAQTLGMNYRVNADVLTALDAIRSNRVGWAVWAAAGFPPMWLPEEQAAAKKK